MEIYHYLFYQGLHKLEHNTLIKQHVVERQATEEVSNFAPKDPVDPKKWMDHSLKYQNYWFWVEE